MPSPGKGRGGAEEDPFGLTDHLKLPKITMIFDRFFAIRSVYSSGGLEGEIHVPHPFT